MALYDVPVHNGFKILTHTSSRRFAKNGFAQVGNTTLPSNPVQPAPVVRSSLYNKNLKGISEAGYGRKYPYYGLSYSGAGSPRGSFLAFPGPTDRTRLGYAGAGSPRASLQYAGAGSPRASLRYAGAGSPRGSVLHDAYINDNPPPETLRVSTDLRRLSLRGLSDDPAPSTSDTAYGPAAPTVDTSGGILNSITGALSQITTSLIQTTASAGQLAADNAVAGAIAGRPSTSQQIVTSVKTATNPKTVLGLSVDTLMLVGIGVGAWYFLKD